MPRPSSRRSSTRPFAGLAQGREVKGDVLFLGGPLFFFRVCRSQETLKLDDARTRTSHSRAVCHRGGRSGVRRRTQKTYTVDSLLAALEKAADAPVVANYLPPLFGDEQQYEEFKHRHAMHDVMTQNVTMYEGDAYLGIDCGSTTTKLVLIGADDQILFHHYQSNKGQSGGRYPRAAHQAVRAVRRPRTYRVLGGHWLRRKRSSRMPSAWISVWSRRSRTSARRAISARMLISSSTSAVRTSSCFQDTQQVHRQYFAQRGVLVRLRLVHRDVPARSMGYSIEEFCKLGLFAKHPIDLVRAARCSWNSWSSRRRRTARALTRFPPVCRYPSSRTRCTRLSAPTRRTTSVSIVVQGRHVPQ